jgi:hypothetical protein
MFNTYNIVNHTKTIKPYPPRQNHFKTTIHFNILSINNGLFQLKFFNKLRREI